MRISCGWILPTSLTAITLAGCAAPGRTTPGLPEPLPTTAPAGVRVAPLLDAARAGVWVYQRSELPARAHRLPVTYRRVVRRSGIAEGALETYQLAPSSRPVRGDASTTKPAAHSMPRGALVAFFDLDQPMTPIPRELESGRPITSSTDVHYRDPNDRHPTSGSLTRGAEIEGVEDVEVPAGVFPGCVRVRIDLTMRLPFTIIDWTTHVWLAREAGEVRRINRLSGWFWIFPFSSAYEYRLVSYQPQPAATQPANPFGPWSRGVVVLDRMLPHPQISGMAVEFADHARTLADSVP